MTEDSSEGPAEAPDRSSHAPELREGKIPSFNGDCANAIDGRSPDTALGSRHTCRAAALNSYICFLVFLGLVLG